MKLRGILILAEMCGVAQWWVVRDENKILTIKKHCRTNGGRVTAVIRPKPRTDLLEGE